MTEITSHWGRQWEAERWVWMWALAGAIFAGVKWSSWRARPVGETEGAGRGLAFLFTWPGMDPRPFLAGASDAARPTAPEWLVASAKTVLGAGLLWGPVWMGETASNWPPLVRAWIGMVGLVFLLHFGSFHLLALGHRQLGTPVVPLMQNPLAARSLGDLWGARWNRGFRDWAHRVLFQPAEARLGAAGATLWVFLVSGLLHEAAISLPAGGGFGGPTLYFLLQGAGTLAERTRAGRRWGLRRGVRGRLFIFTVAALPLGLLFHPPFARRVILPFLEAIGAK